MVAASSVSNQASFESSMYAPAPTGRTHANVAGNPEYWIWSHGTVRVGETANAMRCPATAVDAISEAK